MLPAFRLASLGYGARLTLGKALIVLALSISVAEAEPLEIVALGDSLTAGYGLPEGQGLVPQLQDWLTAQGASVTVVNAGVSGDTTAGGLSRLAWSLTPEVDALIVTLDNPKAREGRGATASASAAPVAGRIVERVAPILGVAPRLEDVRPAVTGLNERTPERSSL